MKTFLVASLFAGAALAQTAAKPAAIPKMPRAPDGHPDMTGVWQPGSDRPGTWEEANRAGTVGGLAPGGNRPTREPAPYQEWAKARVQESFDRRGIDDPTALCIMGGIPRTTTIGLFPIQFVQTPTQVVMLYEYFHEFRVIPLNAKHPDDLEPTYMGDSVGHWEGDTLVVDVTGFNDKSWIGPTGSFHSEAMHVVERYTRVDYNRINYEVRVEDPKVLTKPWIMRSSMMLRPGTRLREYECNEDNEDVKHYEDLLKNETIFRRK